MAFDQDNWLLVEQWLGLVPEAVIQRSRGLLLARAWVKSFRLDLDQVVALLNQLDALGGEAEAAETHFFRGLVAFWSGQAKTALSEFQQSVSLIGGQYSMLAGEMRAYHALSRQMCGDTDTAQRELDREIRLAGSSRTTYVTRIAAAQCYIHYMDANPMQAVRSARYLSDIAEVVDSCYARGWSQYLQALIHLNVGQLEAAETFFSAAANHRHCVEHKLALEILGGLALTQQLRGCLAASEESALAMSDFAHRLGDTEVTELATSFVARLALLRGETDEAVGLSAQLVLRPPSPNLLFFLEEPAVTQLRVTVATGGTSRLRSALDTLGGLRQQLEDVNQHCQLVDIFALQALAYHRLGQEAGALESLTRAVVMATPSEWVRPFLELGSDLEPLLQRLTLDGVAAVFVEGLLAMPQFASTGQSSPAAAAPAEASQALTHRELDILDLLSQRFRNKEIASTLFISNHTVNYHLKHIYHKLGVNGRREAVARARELGVLGKK